MFHFEKNLPLCRFRYQNSSLHKLSIAHRSEDMHSYRDTYYHKVLFVHPVTIISVWTYCIVVIEAFIKKGIEAATLCSIAIFIFSCLMLQGNPKPYLQAHCSVCGRLNSLGWDSAQGTDVKIPGLLPCEPRQQKYVLNPMHHIASSSSSVISGIPLPKEDSEPHNLEQGT